MCEYNNDELYDIGRVIKKYDIYYCDLGDVEDKDKDDHSLGKVRPCIIVSSDEMNLVVSSQYAIIPLRTEHSMTVDSWDKAEHVVNIRLNKGRIYVPILFNDHFRFADVTQLTRISSRKVLNYYKTLTGPVIDRLDSAINKYLFNKVDINKFISNYIKINVPPVEVLNNLHVQNWIIDMMNAFTTTPQYNYHTDCDVYTSIKKYDIWNTHNQLGNIIILQNNNYDQWRYLVAPIIRKNEECIGKIYIPLKIHSKTVFIDMSNLCSISKNQLKDKLYSVVNDTLKDDINKAIMRIIFNDDENPYNIIDVPDVTPLLSTTDNLTEEVYNDEERNEDINTEEVEVKEEQIQEVKHKKPGRKRASLPIGFSIYYNKHKNHQMTIKEMMQKFNVSHSTVYNYIKRYEEMQSQCTVYNYIKRYEEMQSQ